MVKRILLAGIIVFAVGGCSAKDLETGKDAPRSDVVNRTPADRITMPDGFSNVATKCDHGNRIYVAFHYDNPYAAIAAVAGDPTCSEKTP